MNAIAREIRRPEHATGGRAAAERLHARSICSSASSPSCSASAANSSAAPVFIVLGGIADALDGRVARATGTGSRFGEELDSLSMRSRSASRPALIMYFAVLKHGRWEWIFVFIFTACAVMRLARFNVEQAGRAKTHFHGLPSPAAGMTLATYYWFSQTPLYNHTSSVPETWRPAVAAIFAGSWSGSGLMISDVPYPACRRSASARRAERSSALALVVGILGLALIFDYEASSSSPRWCYVLSVRRCAPSRHRRCRSDRDGAASSRTRAAEDVIDERRERGGGRRRPRRDDGAVARSVTSGERIGGGRVRTVPRRPRSNPPSNTPDRTQSRRHEPLSRRRSHRPAPWPARSAGQGGGRRAALARLRRRRATCASDATSCSTSTRRGPQGGRAASREMCERLLANPVTEDFEIARVEHGMKFGIVTFPGSNCDDDAFHAVTRCARRGGACTSGTRTTISQRATS